MINLKESALSRYLNSHKLMHTSLLPNSTTGYYKLNLRRFLFPNINFSEYNNSKKNSDSNQHKRKRLKRGWKMSQNRKIKIFKQWAFKAISTAL